MNFLFWLLFACFATLGALLRFGLGAISARYLLPYSAIPVGTFVANGLGSFLIGYLYSADLGLRSGLVPQLVTLLMVAFLGSLTTFSSFALDTMRMIQSGHLYSAMANVLLTNFTCFWLCYWGMTVKK